MRKQFWRLWGWIEHAAAAAWLIGGLGVGGIVTGITSALLDVGQPGEALVLGGVFCVTFAAATAGVRYIMPWVAGWLPTPPGAAMLPPVTAADSNHADSYLAALQAALTTGQNLHRNGVEARLFVGRDTPQYNAWRNDAFNAFSLFPEEAGRIAQPVARNTAVASALDADLSTITAAIARARRRRT